MDSLRQPKFSQASVWFPSWFHPMLLSGTNGASTPSLFFDSQDDMAIASSRFGHRGVTLNLEESSCFDGNEMREHQFLKPGLFTDSAKGFNVGTASVTCIPREDCCFTNLFKSSDEMSISYSQLNEPNVLLSETITELCILNTDCSQERLKTGPVPIPVDSKLVNIHSPIDMTSQQTSSTQLYEVPVVSGGHEVISAHPSMKLHPYIGDVNEKQGYLMLHGKPAAKTAGDKSKLRAQKRKISDNRKNTSRKKRRHQCVVADIEATVGLTVAAAEAMVIAACFDGCNALHEIGTSAILEAAMQVKKARQMIGLDEFCTEMQTPLDLSDLAEPECLDDYSLHEALADVGIYEVLEDKGMPAPICANVEDNHEVLQQKGKKSTIDTKRPSCNYEQNEEHILLLHHDCAAESSSYKLDPQFANTRQAKISYSSEFNLERSCSDIQHQLANVQNKALQECRIDPEISLEHLATQECERNLALACEKSRSASLTKLHDKTFRAISSNSVVKWRTCSGSASPGCFRSHEQNAVCWKEEKLHTSLSNRVLNREPDANDSSYLLKPFCSRWFGGWKSTENPSDQKIQGLIKPRISQAFPEYQETSYLTESNVPQKLVNLKAVCPNDDNKFIPLSLVKVISESHLPSTEEDQLIISMPEERLENLSQASGACSVSSSDDPLCSFVPCSILSPPGRLMSGTLEYDNNCNDYVPCPTPVKDIKDAEGGVKHTQSLSLRRYSTTSHCLGQLLEAVDSLCSENSKKGTGSTSNRLENEGRKPISNAHCSGQDKAAHESGLVSIENTTSLVSKLPPTYMGGDNSGKGLPVEVSVNAAASQAVTKWKAKVSELPPVHSSCEWQSSPPLLFPRGRRKRLKAGFIIDTGASNETFLEEFQGVDTNAKRDLHMVPASREENIIGLTNEAENNPTESKGGFLDKQNDKIDSALIDSKSTAEGKIEHRKLKELGTDMAKIFCNAKKADTKVSPKEVHQRNLFRGLKFLLTGFTEMRKITFTKLIKECGGVVILNVPPPLSSKVSKTRQTVYRGRPPIIIAAKKVCSPNFLYGCAVGSPLKPSWIMDSISAGRYLPESEYKLICNQETKAGNQYERSLGKGQIFGGMLFLIYGSGAFRSKLTSVLEHGGGQILQRARIVQHEKLGTRVSQIIVVEDINKVPRGVRHSATNLNVPIVSEKWVVESLLHGTLLELPTTSRRCPRKTTTKTSTLPYSYCTRTRTRQRLVNVTTKPSNELTRKPIALKKVVQDSSCHKKNAIEKSFQTCHIDPAFTLVGKGFSFPVEVSLLANVRTKQLHDPTHVKHKPINQLYFKGVSYAGVDYSIGDCVEIWQDSRLKICSSIVRIERLWVKKASIQTRASRLALVEQSKQACYMLCRCFYHPQDTSFAGCGSDKEVFVSNNFKEAVPIRNLRRKVKLSVRIGGKILICSDQAGSQNELKSECSLRSSDLNKFDYLCNFFYDHEQQSLHQLS